MNIKNLKVIKIKYEHTQIGKLMIAIIIILAICFAIILSTEFNWGIIIFAILILFIVSSFSTLSVIVNKDQINIKFGYGLFKRNFSSNKIVSVKTVKNKWYYGWGIRVWLWPKIIIFNVSGFDAVEIKMNNGKIYRIGTDDPKDLKKAISKSIKTRRK